MGDLEAHLIEIGFSAVDLEAVDIRIDEERVQRHGDLNASLLQVDLASTDEPLQRLTLFLRLLRGVGRVVADVASLGREAVEVNALLVEIDEELLGRGCWEVYLQETQAEAVALIVGQAVESNTRNLDLAVEERT